VMAYRGRLGFLGVSIPGKRLSFGDRATGNRPDVFSLFGALI